MQMFAYASDMLGYLTKVAKAAGCDKNDLDYLVAISEDKKSGMQRFEGAIPFIDDCDANEDVIRLALAPVVKKGNDLDLKHEEVLLTSLIKKSERLNEIIQGKGVYEAEAKYQAFRQPRIEQLGCLLEAFQHTGSIDPSIVISGSFTYEDQIIYELQILQARDKSLELSRLENTYIELEEVLNEIETAKVVIDSLKELETADHLVKSLKL